MDDTNLLRILDKGVTFWNAWRLEHPERLIILSREDFFEMCLRGIDFSGADLQDAAFGEGDLSGANLKGANLIGASFNGTDLSGADLRGAYLTRAACNYANFSNANLSGAHLDGTDLGSANFSSANLRDADLEKAVLERTNLSDAVLEGCKVYGVSAWGLILDGAKQNNLRITPPWESTITVDDLEVAQFIYLMLNNQKVRNIINTITTKAVLILGRFTPERMAVLDAIRNELRQRDYLPILFDFEKPSNRDITETVSTLAHLARFIIADITEAKSVPQELMRIVPSLPSVPVQPLLQRGANEYGMFEHFKRFPWVLDTVYYDNVESVCLALSDKIVGPAEIKVKEQP